MGAAKVIASVLGVGSGESVRPDSVKEATRMNRERFAEPGMRDAAKFLVEMADARMMDTMEGQVAGERGVNAEVRAYGQTMVKDQAALLTEIKALAAQKGITLPDHISDSKAHGLEDLVGKSGDSVDSKFISMITIDHKRDVGEFKDATKLSDPEVRGFAERRLPMIEQHLAEIKGIHERQ